MQQYINDHLQAITNLNLNVPEFQEYFQSLKQDVIDNLLPYVNQGLFPSLTQVYFTANSFEDIAIDTIILQLEYDEDLSPYNAPNGTPYCNLQQNAEAFAKSLADTIFGGDHNMYTYNAVINHTIIKSANPDGDPGHYYQIIITLTEQF